MKMDNSTKLDAESKLWLEKKLIPNLKLELKQKDSVTNYELLPSSVILVMSRIIFLELKFGENQEEKAYSLVVKRPPREEFMREMSLSDKVFHNEIMFYNKYAKNSADYPRCFYTHEEPPTNSVLVLENISQKGYHICPQMVDLDMKYVVAAMQEIGKFHAKAYIQKNKCPNEFSEFVKNIQETRFINKEKNLFRFMVNYSTRKVIKRLREKGYDKVFCDKAEIFFSDAFKNVMIPALNQKQPLATLCHGDFTRNNIFFKESDSGVKGMLFDFALINYGSPAIDLSTFFYLSVKREDAKKRFSEIFNAYHDSLMNYLKASEIKNLQEFSKDRFLEDYKRHALFGYIIASFFLPILLGSRVPNFNEFKSLSEKEMEALVQKNFNNVEDKFTEVLVIILLDMRESGCLRHVEQ